VIFEVGVFRENALRFFVERSVKQIAFTITLIGIFGFHQLVGAHRPAFGSDGIKRAPRWSPWLGEYEAPPEVCLKWTKQENFNAFEARIMLPRERVGIV
jgi:hypothetical protein